MHRCRTTGAAMAGCALLLVSNAHAATVGVDSPGYVIEEIGLFDAEHRRGSDGYQQNRAEHATASGYAAGFAYRYPGSSSKGRSAWIHDGETTTRLGLTDSAHTRTDAYQYSDVTHLNDSGVTAGFSLRYTYTEVGRSAWVYDGSTTRSVGLVGSNYAYGSTRFSEVTQLNDIGQAMGRTIRYGSNGANLGQMAFLFNGTSSLAAGLRDAEHTRNTDGYQDSRGIRLNNNGQLIGTSYRYNSSGINMGRSAWFSNGYSTTRIGLWDASHTRSTDGYQKSGASFINDSGQVAGASDSFVGSGVGSSSWFFDGSQTVKIGLYDTDHTLFDGTNSNLTKAMNASGQVAGSARQANWGESVWLYDGNQTTRVGLYDAEHTLAGYGEQRNSFVAMNEAGQVAGDAQRFANNASHGSSAWLYRGSDTIKLGLMNAEHQGDEDGFQSHSVRFLNNAGEAAGVSDRWGLNGSDYQGRSAWFFDGTDNVQIGLLEDVHTRNSDGFRDNLVSELSEGGHVAGFARRYADDGSSLGQDAWLFDGDNTILLGGLSESSTGNAFSAVEFLSADGWALGQYYRYSETDSYTLGLFGYSEESGLIDLGLSVIEGFDDWERLSTALMVGGDGSIYGWGVLDSFYSNPGITSYKLTPAAVPIPAAAWLFGSALMGLGWLRRRPAA